MYVFLTRLALVMAALVAALASGEAAANGSPVQVVTPERVSLIDELRLTGTVTAERSARISPRVDGLVARLTVDAGDRVKAGDVLLEMDAELATHALRRAQAEAAQQRAQLEEAQRLAEEAARLAQDRHLPRTEVERREAELRLAQAAYAAAQAAEREQAELVRRHALPAPFAGVIARRLTEVGEWVSRGTPVLELVATDRLRLDLQAPQEQFAAIGSDAAVEVRPANAPDRVLPGRIVARVPVGEAGARTFLVRVLIDDAEDGLLLPGASATAIIELRGAKTALAAPRDALLRYPDGSHSVFVVMERDGKTIARERRVEIGRGGERVEIVSGLKPGERIVVRGNEMLRDGDLVRVVGESSADPG